MRTAINSRWWIVAAAAVLLALPAIVRVGAPGASNYLLNNYGIGSLVWVAFALSYDLSVGHAGTVTLAHPAFFGIGAYTAAVLSTAARAPFVTTVVVALVLAGAAALVIGALFLRLSDVFFAIGTLGVAFMANIVAVNWQSVTKGALCITQIPRPHWAADLTGFYYLILAIAAATGVVYVALTRGRVGRALAAVRGDEGLAQTFGANPFFYKMLAFVVGAMLAAFVGVFQAYHVSVVCPDTLGTFYTLNLLIIVFLGGVGTMRGVVLGAVLFTIIPELARFAQVFAQLAYGVVLLLVVLYAPDGVEGALGRALHRRRAVSIWGRETAGDQKEARAR